MTVHEAEPDRIWSQGPLGPDTLTEFPSIPKFIVKIRTDSGVTGVGERSFLTTALLNAAFAHLNLPVRCLPLQVGNVRLFRKIIEAVDAALERVP